MSAAEVLRAGGVVLLPTDTVLGLAALPASADKIYTLKERPREKNLPIMVADQEQFESLGAVITPTAATLLSSQYVPGALTIVCALDPRRSPSWLRGRTEMAVRIPNSELLLELLKEVGPLMVTSANRSGMQTPDTTDAALAQLNGAPDLTLTGRAQKAQPSTIVNCAVTPPKIERIGAIARAQIEAVIGETQ